MGNSKVYSSALSGYVFLNLHQIYESQYIFFNVLSIPHSHLQNEITVFAAGHKMSTSTLVWNGVQHL